MDKQDRAEAGEYPFLGPPTTFSKAFPTIASLEVNLEAHVGAMEQEPRRLHFTLESPPAEFVSCILGSKKCRDGGWRIVDEIKSMVARRETARQVSGHCEGYEPMGRSRRRCLVLFRGEIVISYR